MEPSEKWVLREEGTIQKPPLILAMNKYHIPQPLKTAPPTRDHVFKTTSLWGVVHIQTMTHSWANQHFVAWHSSFFLKAQTTPKHKTMQSAQETPAWGEYTAGPTGP